MKNFFKKIKEKIVDFANYNTDEVVSDKKSEVGKQVPTEKPSTGEGAKHMKVPSEREPEVKGRKKDFYQIKKEPEFIEQEPSKTNHPVSKTGKTVFRKRENIVEKKSFSGRTQGKPDKTSKRKHGNKKYKKQGR